MRLDDAIDIAAVHWRLGDVSGRRLRLYVVCLQDGGAMSKIEPRTDGNALLDDGYGNVWHKCEPYDQCAMEIVRPGKVQCERCQFKDEKPLSNVDG